MVLKVLKYIYVHCTPSPFIFKSNFSNHLRIFNKLFSLNFILMILFYTNILLAANHSINSHKPSGASFPLFHKNQNDKIIGNINISNNNYGIMVSGMVYGVIPNWPSFLEEIALKDHIEIWLTDSNRLKLPLIGWGNQFEATGLTEKED